MENMNFTNVAKNIAIDKKLARAVKYDLHVRDYDNLVEVVGLIDDPTIEAGDFKGREAMIPKKWVTLDVMSVSDVESYNV
jgi:hypothetical protein